MPNPLARHRMIPVPLWLSAGMSDNKARTCPQAKAAVLCKFAANSVPPQTIKYLPAACLSSADLHVRLGPGL